MDAIRAEYTTPAAAHLRAAIADYAFIRGEGLQPKIIRPRTGAVLSIRLEGGVSVAGRSAPPIAVGGVHERPYALVPSRGRADFVRVQFTAGGLRYFTPAAADALRDRTVAAEELFPCETVTALLSDLRGARGVEQRRCLLDRFFARLYTPLSRTDELVLQFACRLADEADRDGRSILSGAPLGPRQMQRLFARLIGFSPRKFVQVARFERAERGVLSSDSPSLGDVALETGYYDQAHFNRDFKRFVAISPGSYHFCVPAAEARVELAAESANH